MAFSPELFEKLLLQCVNIHLHADVEAFQTVLGTKEIANDK